MTHLRFRILGPLECNVDGQWRTPGAAKVRALFTALLCHANRVVSVEQLAGYVWGAQRPKSAHKLLQLYVHRVRGLLGIDLADRLVTREHGYLFRVDDSELDTHRFESLAERAQQAAAVDDHPNTVLHSRNALSLWRGVAVEDLTNSGAGCMLSTEWEERRLGLIDLLFRAELGQGHHAAVVGELRSLVRAFPLQESLHEYLIHALALAGRRVEAVAAFHDLRRILAAELGVHPSPAVTDLVRSTIAPAS